MPLAVSPFLRRPSIARLRPFFGRFRSPVLHSRGRRHLVPLLGSPVLVASGRLAPRCSPCPPFGLPRGPHGRSSLPAFPVRGRPFGLQAPRIVPDVVGCSPREGLVLLTSMPRGARGLSLGFPLVAP